MLSHSSPLGTIGFENRIVSKRPAADSRRPTRHAPQGATDWNKLTEALEASVSQGCSAPQPRRRGSPRSLRPPFAAAPTTRNPFALIRAALSRCCASSSKRRLISARPRHGRRLSPNSCLPQSYIQITVVNIFLYASLPEGEYSASRCLKPNLGLLWLDV